MVSTRLRIGTESNFGIFDNIPIELIYQISDIRTPTDKKATQSKTVVIPASQEANILFENLFEVNVELLTFNPSLKTNVTYYVDELVALDGYLQLLKINLNESTGKVTYECSVVGELGSVFSDISGLYLTDINWANAYPSYSTHSLTTANVQSSWAAAAGAGAYVYPLIDWGVNNSNMSFISPQHLKGCFFAYDYVTRIFADQGYTFTSSFFSSSFFKKLIIPPNDIVTLDSTTINNNKFLAYVDATQFVTLTTTRPSVGILGTAASTTTILYPTETYDTGNIYNNGTSTFQVPLSNKYNFKASVSLNFKVFLAALDISANITGLTGNVNVYLNSSTNTVASATIPIANISFAASNSNNLTINMPNVDLVALETYTVSLTIGALVLNLAPDTGVGAYSTKVSIVDGSYSAELASNSVYEGSTVAAADLIPKNVKQYDFLKSIFKMFNLYAVIDKTNQNNYLIEPRISSISSFYKTASNALDWTDKHAEDSDTEIIPIGELNAVRYNFTYKDDGDFYNVDYKNNYNETYGTHKLDVTNDFIKGEQTTDVIFSPTPYAVNPNFAMVCATIIKKDNLQIAPIKPNIRILYYSGSVALPSTQWTLVRKVPSLATYTYTTFPHAGHTDNPYAPNLDLNWGFPKKVYYNFPNLQWTTKNLYNEYYSQYFGQITDKDSKIVITDFYLTPTDINQLDFRYPIKFNLDGNPAYYTINKITYNPQVSKVSRVELLKLADGEIFVEQTLPLSDNITGDSSNSQNRAANGNISGGNSIIIGENSTTLGGGNNYIA